MVMSYVQRTRLDCKIESFYTTGRQEKNDCFSVDGLYFQSNSVFEVMGCFHQFCASQKCVHLSLKNISNVAIRRELDALRQEYEQKEGSTVISRWECEWWRLYETTNNVKQHIRENFLDRRSLTEHQLLLDIEKVNVFGYLQSDIAAPQKMRAKVVNFFPIFKNDSVSKDDIEVLMKIYAEEEKFLSKPRKMLISSFTLQTRTLITPLFLFYLKLRLVCTKSKNFLEYTPKKCFNVFAQSAMDATRQSAKNTDSSVVAEAMKFLANSSYGYQIMEKVHQWQKDTCSYQ